MILRQLEPLMVFERDLVMYSCNNSVIIVVIGQCSHVISNMMAYIM